MCARSSGRVKSSRANRTSKGAEKWLDVQEHKHGTAACIAYLKVLPSSSVQSLIKSTPGQVSVTDGLVQQYEIFGQVL